MSNAKRRHRRRYRRAATSRRAFQRIISHIAKTTPVFDFQDEKIKALFNEPLFPSMTLTSTYKK